MDLGPNQIVVGLGRVSAGSGIKRDAALRLVQTQQKKPDQEATRHTEPSVMPQPAVGRVSSGQDDSEADEFH
jgi:hypothetical protein